MNAMTLIVAAEPLDDIRCFLPGIDAEEYARRAKLRSLRNTAAAMIARTECATARQLAWIASDYATELVYSPADPVVLDDVAKFCTRLMISAMHVERLETVGAVA